MVIDEKIFFKTYLAEYHWHKVSLLKSLIESHQDVFKKVIGKKQSKEEAIRFLKMLKAEMRQTYFHCMETMFTILFGLDPNTNGFKDESLLYTITRQTIDYVYSRVNTIASTNDGLKFLDNKIKVNGRKKEGIHVGKYIFYKGLGQFNSKTENVKQEIEDSIEAIKYGIKLLAIDFSDRDEYNSYKHGLRIIPALSKITAIDVNNQERKIELDFDDSMSYFSRKKSIDTSNSIESVSITFDTDRDYAMTTFCSNLITSMIEPRRAIIHKDSLNL